MDGHHAAARLHVALEGDCWVLSRKSPVVWSSTTAAKSDRRLLVRIPGIGRDLDREPIAGSQGLERQARGRNRPVGVTPMRGQHQHPEFGRADRQAVEYWPLVSGASLGGTTLPPGLERQHHRRAEDHCDRRPEQCPPTGVHAPMISASDSRRQRGHRLDGGWASGIQVIHRNHLGVGDDEDPFSRLRGDHAQPGKAAEGRQDRHALADHEAGQTLAEEPRPGQNDPGVHVSGQGIADCRRGLVPEHEWWKKAGASTQLIRRSVGGSPAWRSWLPRTNWISSVSRDSRQRRKSARVRVATRPARAWKRSPRTMRRRAPVRPTAWSSRSKSSRVAPPGMGIPAARKVAALPQWTSATTSVHAAGQKSARSGSSRTGSPASSRCTSDGTVTVRPRRRCGSRGDRRGETVRSRLGGTLERRHQAPDPIDQLLRGELLAGAIDQQRERERSRALDLDHGGAATGDPVEGASETALLQLPLQHFAVRLGHQQVVGVVAGEYVVEQLARGLQLLHRLGTPGNPVKISPATRAISRNWRRASSAALRLAGMSCSRCEGESNPASSASSSGARSAHSSSRP